uniref:Uncharacterized protein n=1 Tax=Accipiter nisus TaxID=211598 RepID=A0A8B9M175_9AVES
SVNCPFIPSFRCRVESFTEKKIIFLHFLNSFSSVHCHRRSYLLLSSFHAVIQDFKEFF